MYTHAPIPTLTRIHTIVDSGLRVRIQWLQYVVNGWKCLGILIPTSAHSRFGHKEVVKFLISNAPVCILDMVDNEKGQTALHKAAGYKRR